MTYLEDKLLVLKAAEQEAEAACVVADLVLKQIKHLVGPLLVDEVFGKAEKGEAPKGGLSIEWEDDGLYLTQVFEKRKSPLTPTPSSRIRKVWYISYEELVSKLKARNERLGLPDVPEAVTTNLSGKAVPRNEQKRTAPAAEAKQHSDKPLPHA